jgi:acyl carrier protein
MLQKNFTEKFNSLLIDKLNVNEEEIKSEAKFIDLGADSLDMVELIIDFEKIFFITIPDNDAEKIITIGDAEKYLKTRLNIN